MDWWRRFAAVLALGSVVIGLAACCGRVAERDEMPAPATLPANLEVIEQLRVVEDGMRRGEFDRRYREAPIIDVHTHGFNARDLPLRGILYSRKSSSLHGAPTVLLAAIADLVAFACAPAGAAFGPEIGGRELADRARERALENVPPGQRARIAKDSAFLEMLGIIEQERDAQVRFAAEFEGDGDGPVRPWRLDEEYQAMRAPRAALSGYGLVRFPVFVGHLISRHRTAAERYERWFGLGDREAILVVHTMDLAPVYDQDGHPLGERLLVDFAAQLDAAAALEAESDGRVVHFVAYNPYRDHWPKDGVDRAGRALEIIRAATLEDGFVGVKVYPPSGYRPAGNDIAEPPQGWFCEPREQWKARYEDGRGRRLDAGELDERLCALLDFCVEHQIPVFTHCSTGEFQPQPYYGLDNSGPAYWRRYLESGSTPGGFDRRTLRLCLGHAGGSYYWFGSGSHEGWGRAVYELCTEFENVFCEIGVHDQVGDCKRRAFFAGRLIELFERDDRVAYPFAGKLLYGTDWFMPIATHPAEYLAGYETVFLHPDLEKHYHGFFRRNAAAFLNVKHEDGRGRVDQRTIDRLKRARDWQPR